MRRCKNETFGLLARDQRVIVARVESPRGEADAGAQPINGSALTMVPTKLRMLTLSFTMTRVDGKRQNRYCVVHTSKVLCTTQY